MRSMAGCSRYACMCALMIISGLCVCIAGLTPTQPGKPWATDISCNTMYGCNLNLHFEAPSNWFHRNDWTYHVLQQANSTGEFISVLNRTTSEYFDICRSNSEYESAASCSTFLTDQLDPSTPYEWMIRASNTNNASSPFSKASNATVTPCADHCNGNGHCEGKLCKCNNGWTGPDCLQLVCLADCSGHGQCQTPQGDDPMPTCGCSDGWHGAACADLDPPPGPGCLTKSNVAKHSSDTDCWLIIDDKVYDVTGYLRDGFEGQMHPGGNEPIIEYCGAEASEAFDEEGHADDALAMLKTYLVGPKNSCPGRNHSMPGNHIQLHHMLNVSWQLTEDYTLEIEGVSSGGWVAIGLSNDGATHDGDSAVAWCGLYSCSIQARTLLSYLPGTIANSSRPATYHNMSIYSDIPNSNTANTSIPLFYFKFRKQLVSATAKDMSWVPYMRNNLVWAIGEEQVRPSEMFPTRLHNAAGSVSVVFQPAVNAVDWTRVFLVTVWGALCAMLTLMMLSRKKLRHRQYAFVGFLIVQVASIILTMLPNTVTDVFQGPVPSICVGTLLQQTRTWESDAVMPVAVFHSALLTVCLMFGIDLQGRYCRRLSQPVFPSNYVPRWCRVLRDLTVGDVCAGVGYLALCSWWVQFFLPDLDGGVSDSTNIAVALGHLAELQLALVLLPVTRRSVWGAAFCVPWEQALKLHRVCGVLFLACMYGHALCWLIYWEQQYHTIGECLRNECNTRTGTVWTGIAVGCVGLVMSVGALEQVRRRYYELFLATHFLFPVFIVFAVLHSTYTTTGHLMQYLCLPLIMQLVDITMRVVQRCAPLNEAQIHQQAHGAVMLKVPLARLPPHCAMYYLVCIPELSRWQWHPLSVSSVDIAQDSKREAEQREDMATLVVKGSGDLDSWTRRLFALAATNTSVGIQLEGPYGDSCLHLDQYRVAVLVAAGIGFTPVMSMLQGLSQMPATGSLCKIHCVWFMKTKASLEWFEDELEQVLRTSSVPIKLHLSTRAICSDASSTTMHNPLTEELTSCLSDLKECRLDNREGYREGPLVVHTHSRSESRNYINSVLATVMTTASSCDMHQCPRVGVFMCAPSSLVDEFSDAMHDAKLPFDIHTEAFGW